MMEREKGDEDYGGREAACRCRCRRVNDGGADGVGTLEESTSFYNL